MKLVEKKKTKQKFNLDLMVETKKKLWKISGATEDFLCYYHLK